MSRDLAVRPPIFVVGVPRSGTTLLAAMLCAHSRLSCGPETHFFDELNDEAEAKMRAPEGWPAEAVGYLYSIIHGNSSVPEHYGVDRDEVTRYLENARPGVASTASALPELFMKRYQKCRWIDKTPDHLPHVQTIRRHFPTAPIIRIVRDPRDVALSLAKVPWGPASFLESLLLWNRYHSASASFFESDRAAYSVRYEDLVLAPERELSRLCAFLGEVFEAQMLDTSQSGAHVNRTKEAWKNRVTEKVDPSRVHTWKTILTPDQKRQADALIGGCTEERSVLAKNLTYVSVSSLSTLKNRCDVDFLARLINDYDVRFWPAHAHERPIGRLFTGISDSSEWLGRGSSSQRLVKALDVARRIVMYRMCGQPVVWPWITQNNPSNLGYCSKLFSLVLGRKPVAAWDHSVHRTARGDHSVIA